jgi:phosphate-selective porin OprO/OprP
MMMISRCTLLFSFILVTTRVCFGEIENSAGERAALDIDNETLELKEAPPEVVGDEEYHFKWGFEPGGGLQYSLNQVVALPDWMPIGRPEEYRRLDGRLGVKMHFDAAAFKESGEADSLSSDPELRRGRIYTQGNTYLIKPMDFRVEAGFSGSDFFLNQFYLRWHELLLLKSIQIGLFKAPFSLEMMESSGVTTFLERASPVTAFAPGTQLGLQVGGPVWNERVTWAIGGFAGVSKLDVGDASESAVGPMLRLTALPVNVDQEGDRKLVHLGLGINYRESREDAFRYQSRPETFIAPKLLDTDDIEGDDALVYNLEVAGAWGPGSLQAEFFHTFVGRGGESDVEFMGAYGLASWFLTGESRAYSKTQGRFAHVKPHEHFSVKKRTWGAWELAGRLSWLDLSDEDIRGGRMRNLTAGLNWYWTRDTRVMFNYVYSDIDDGPESRDLQIFQLRFQLEL